MLWYDLHIKKDISFDFITHSHTYYIPEDRKAKFIKQTFYIPIKQCCKTDDFFI